MWYVLTDIGDTGEFDRCICDGYETEAEALACVEDYLHLGHALKVEFDPED